MFTPLINKDMREATARQAEACKGKDKAHWDAIKAGKPLIVRLLISLLWWQW